MELLLVIALLAGQGARVEGLDALTKKSLRGGPWTITSVAAPTEGLAKNDYYSEAPYWWPDPKDPKAPFLRRDGETYPQRFDAHRKLLGQMSEGLLGLGLRAALLGDKDALRKGGRGGAGLVFESGDADESAPGVWPGDSQPEHGARGWDHRHAESDLGGGGAAAIGGG